MFTDELKQVREIAKTTSRIANHKGGYLDFLETAAKEEDARIQAITSESNRLMQAVEQKKRSVAVQAERRRLQIEPTPEIQQVIPQVAPDISQMSQEQVTQKIAEAVKIFRSRIEISKADWALLCNFLAQNSDSVDTTDVAVWEKALQFIIDRLTLLENGGPLPEPVTIPVTETIEAKNPYPQSSHPQSAHFLWEMNNLREQVYAEFEPVVRETLEPIIKSDTKDFEAASIRHLVDTLRKKNLVINRDNIRKAFLEIWGREMNPESLAQAFTEAELADWKNDLEDRHLTSEQIKMKYLYGKR